MSFNVLIFRFCRTRICKMLEKKKQPEEDHFWSSIFFTVSYNINYMLVISVGGKGAQYLKQLRMYFTASGN